MKKFSNIFTYCALSLVLVACNNVDYMNRKSYANFKESQGYEAFKPSKFDGKQPRSYGGLIIKKNPEAEVDTTNLTEDNDDNYYVAVKRKKSRVFAETILFEAENKENSYIDETFFDMGIDHKKKGLSFGLTLRY